MSYPILEVREGRYVACFIWTVFIIQRNGEAQCGDLFGMLYHDPGAKEWVFDYRHRWYRDDKHWDSVDEKSAHRVTAPITEPEEAVAAKLLTMFTFAQQSFPGGTVVIEPPHPIWVRTDQVEEVARVLTAQSFVQTRADPENEPS